MSNEHKNDQLIKKVVTDYLGIKDLKEMEKWEKYFIFMMLN
ncbi:MAG: hypothetical protein ACOWWR_00800 [Eubacteriales bacterium]